MMLMLVVEFSHAKSSMLLKPKKTKVAFLLVSAHNEYF